MNRKWNLFSRKKGAKTDSHGTTLANEEIQFQRGPGNDFQWGGGNRNRESLLNTDVSKDAVKTSTGNNPAVASIPAKQPPEIKTTESSTDGEHQWKSNEEGEEFNKSGHHNQLRPSKGVLDPDKTTAYNPSPLIPVAKVSRTSPRVTKKLIKPGGANGEQPSFIHSSSTANQVVSISDEYTDPYDAVTTNQSKADDISAADRYLEPYKAQQMYHDATHVTDNDIEHHSGRKLYDDPWDKTKQSGGERSDYEEPWDNNQTLPVAGKRLQDLHLSKMGKPGQDKHSELMMEYPNTGDSRSSESSTSSSSAGLVKKRMVKVDSPLHSPRNSPLGSPVFDRRLIKPKEIEVPGGSIDPRLQLYGTGANAKYKPVDHRLVKAEPSLVELRRNSPNYTKSTSSKSSSKTNSPVGSNHASPNQSPVCTLAGTAAANNLGSDALRRSSSPLVSMNMSRFIANKTKCRSLDAKGQQFLPNARIKNGSFIPKSASDDQLTHVTLNNPPAYRGCQSLVGVAEYEEPWDGDGQQSNHELHHVRPIIAHSRSKSYELGCTPNVPVRHGKSSSFDKRDLMHMACEHPWDQGGILPQTHLESMQRFQDRQLELHPSEAICPRDFDPLAPLEKQCWFHGSITRDDANRRLEREVEGSYLVRNSESIPSNYSLSLRARTETIHMVISRTRDGYWILGEFSAPFHSIPEMIAFYAAHRLKINDIQQISLKFPVPLKY